MKLSPHALDSDVAEALRAEATDRQNAHVRDLYRAKIVVALEVATGEVFTFGDWADNSYHELEDGNVTSTLVNPNNSADCMLVSETRHFVLRTSDIHNDLSGLDAAGIHQLFDLDVLLETNTLVAIDTGANEPIAS